MAVEVLLWCVAVLLGTAPAAIVGARRAATTILVYGIALLISIVALSTAALALARERSGLGSNRAPADRIAVVGLTFPP
jgi:hypothetical protein